MNKMIDCSKGMIRKSNGSIKLLSSTFLIAEVIFYKNVLTHDEKREETERQNKKSVYDISSSESEKSDSDNEKENFRPGKIKF